jgi:hypothetical protein
LFSEADLCFFAVECCTVPVKPSLKPLRKPDTKYFVELLTYHIQVREVLVELAFVLAVFVPVEL